MTRHWLPNSIEELDSVWLTAALRQNTPSMPEVLAVRAEPIGEGFGLTSQIARLFLSYAVPESPLPSTLVAKLSRAIHASPPSAAKTSDDPAWHAFERFAREVRFYREIAPRSTGVAPYAYFAAADEERLAVVLLLEDLEGWNGGDVLQGCSIAEAQVVLEAIAPLHAAWWDDRESSHVIPAGLPRWGGDYAARQRRYRDQLRPFLDRWGHSLSVEIIELAERLARCYGSVLAAIDALPAAVIHADLHLDNVMFAPKRGDRQVVILDWQSVCRGPAAVDFTQFVVGSLTPEERSHADGDLCARYAELLRANGVPGYGADQLFTDCRLVLLWLLAGTVGWLARTDAAALSGREQELVLAALGDGRLISALIDYDVAGLIRDFRES